MLAEKLQRPALAGGLALDNSDAAAALAQLEQLGRLIKVVEPTSKGVGGAPEAEPAVATAPAGAAGPGSAKGKSSKGPGPKGAKGPAPPSPQQPQAGGGGAAENVAAPDAGSPTPGGKKGKKGSPPPPPGVAKGSVGATSVGDTQAVAGPAPGPKGSAMPPAKGGKGPAPPPGKGPGGGKGPPAPGGGKGPPAPAGPGGKGPAGPAGPVAGGKKGGKGKGGAVQLTKPVRKPAVPMKSLQWIRRVYGGGLVKGESIWDEVNTVYDESHIPTEEIEARFSKSAGLMKVEKAGQEKATKKIKEYTVLPSQERLPFEVMATSLPPTDKLAKAIQNMDDEFMSAQWIKVIRAVSLGERAGVWGAHSFPFFVFFCLFCLLLSLVAYPLQLQRLHFRGFYGNPPVDSSERTCSPSAPMQSGWSSCGPFSLSWRRPPTYRLGKWSSTCGPLGRSLLAACGCAVGITSGRLLTSSTCFRSVEKARESWNTLLPKRTLHRVWSSCS